MCHVPAFFALCVSIHASAREATKLNFLVPSVLLVSIHASAREATITSDSNDEAEAGFNPRLREGGDNVIRLWCAEHAVSIHASAREVT